MRLTTLGLKGFHPADKQREGCCGMADPDDGRRQYTVDVVLYWMGRRGMTRQIFADRMGKSLSWVDKIRTGDRQLDRLSVLQQIARVLDIPLTVPPTPR